MDILRYLPINNEEFFADSTGQEDGEDLQDRLGEEDLTDDTRLRVDRKV